MSPFETETNLHVQRAIYNGNMVLMQSNYYGHSLIEFLENIRKPRSCKCNRFGCDNNLSDFRSCLETLAHRVEELVKGLCLNCFTAGRTSSDEGNCNAREASKCKVLV